MKFKWTSNRFMGLTFWNPKHYSSVDFFHNMIHLTENVESRTALELKKTIFMYLRVKSMLNLALSLWSEVKPKKSELTLFRLKLR